ncbi:MAG: DNA-binding protein [Pseudobutyrivibrio sp.]|nr:DNA-binding protein [Pseudobutyrivibrio sp.]
MINYSIAIMSCKPGTKKTEQTYSTKAYGTAQIHESLDLDAFCKHIADHNSPFSKGTVKGILTDAVACLREQLLAGNKVSLGDLGSFYVELATEGADTTDEFNAQKIKEVNVAWLPGKEFKNLRADAEFNLVPSRKAQAEAIEVIRNEETIQGLE